MFMADRIAVMRDGRIVQQGCPTELYCAPSDAFVAAFFGDVNQIEGRVFGGRVETPLGPVPAEGFEDGDRVSIVLRPEAVRLEAMEDGGAGLPFGEVEQARLLGRTSLVHLTLRWQDDRLGEMLHLHARVPGVYLPRPGAEVRVSVDTAQTFVFPLSDPKL